MSSKTNDSKKNPLDHWNSKKKFNFNHLSWATCFWLHSNTDKFQGPFDGKEQPKYFQNHESKTIKASSLLWHTRWWLVVWKTVYTIKSMFFIDLKRLLKMSVHKSISIWVFTLLLSSLKRLEVLHIIQVRCIQRLPIATKNELIIIFCRNNESSWNFNQENPLWNEERELTVFVTGDRNNRFCQVLKCK